MPDTDLIEQEVEEQEDIVQAGEPQTGLDKVQEEKPLDREGLFNEALGEGVEEAVISELAEKEGEITVDDLRKLPGAEDYTDEQLVAEWKKAVASVGKGEASTEVETAPEGFKLPFPIYDAQGNKIEALDKISLQELLEGKLQIGYTAMGKEQRKTLAETLRNASLGHFNQHKYETTVGERNSIAQENATLRQQIEQQNSERKVWDAALTALTMGNTAPMQKLAEAYKAAITAMPQAAPGMVPADQVRQEQEQMAQGFQALQQHIIPAGMEIAKRYGADPQEVLGAIQWFIEHEPSQFFTLDKLNSIIQYEVPQWLESYGFRATGQASQQTSQQQPDELSELKKQVAALQSRIAEQKNERTQQVRDKSKKAPPVGGGSTPGAGESMPSFKSRGQMKAYMSGDPDLQKA